VDAIRTENLSKRYQGLRTVAHALSGLDLEVSPGEIFGYLGPNGAGKTTTLKLLMGLTLPSSGGAWLFGRPVGDPRARQGAGFMPEHPSAPGHLTCEELLTLCGRLSGLSRSGATRRAKHLLERTGLEEAARKRMHCLSKGMLQWLGLAQALVGEPQVLILDEPMSGLDPVGRRRMRDIILEERARGTTVFFSSHILADVEMICDRVGILLRGTLVQCGQLSRILNRRREGAEIRVTNLPPDVAERIVRMGAGIRRFGEETLIELQDGDGIDRVLQWTADAGARVQAVVPHRESLEEFFLEQVRCRTPEPAGFEGSGETGETSGARAMAAMVLEPRERTESRESSARRSSR